MKYRHISAYLQQFVVLMLVINHLCLCPAWLIPTSQNSKPLLIGQYTTVNHILFYMHHIHNIKFKIDTY